MCTARRPLPVACVASDSDRDRDRDPDQDWDLDERDGLEPRSPHAVSVAPVTVTGRRDSNSNHDATKRTHHQMTTNKRVCSGGHDPAAVKYTQLGATMAGGDEAVELTLVDAIEGVDPESGGRLPDVVAATKMLSSGATEPSNPETIETYFSIAIQVFIPFLIAGFGTVGAGLVLDVVQHWMVYEEVTEIVILVPALLGLKGNLEMTLASRLSTQANLGHMDTPRQQWSMIVGNLTLIQCQATVVGFLGSVVAIVMGAIHSRSVEYDHALLLCASSLVTASVASFVLGLITAAVIILSRRCNINPDNVATPIAASLGDITSLSLLSWVSTELYYCIGKQDWLAPLIILVYVALIPLWVFIAKKNTHTREVLYTGWMPVVIAMMISSVGGVILNFMVARFEDIAVFQPVINGVGGNLVAVQASRISTSLHRLGPDVESKEPIFITPMACFFGRGPHSRTTRVLMSLVLPGQLIFIYVINYMKAGQISLTPVFTTVYLGVAVMQVAILLYLAYIVIHWMWRKGIDPDNSAIPYLTSMGDLMGISLLAIAFQVLYVLGDRELDSDV